MSVWHGVAHVFGIDTQQSWWYDFWSGVGTQLTLLGGIAVALRHRNCHVKGCWRLGHPDHGRGGRPACRRHHSYDA